MKLLIVRLTTLLAWLALSIPLHTEPLGNAFNYLGRLSQAGEPARGDYDFRFTLYTAATGGSIAGTPLSASGLGVTNGVFAVTLDFGPNAFDGQARYLELAVRPTGSPEDPTILAPRQALSPTPYALVAGSVPNRAITQAKLALGAVGADQISSGAISGAKLAGGTVGPEHLRPGTATAILQADGQSGVASGGLVLSTLDPNPALEGAGYVRLGSTHLGDAWRSLAPTPQAPGSRTGHTTLWTGQEMILWGGRDAASEDLNTGGRYDPANDVWRPTSRRGAPTPRLGHTATWTGREMIVWGGDAQPLGALRDGARYNPSTDTWTPMPPPPGVNFSGRSRHVAVWTGQGMLIWGGASPLIELGDGAAYDPERNTWRAISTLNSPSPRLNAQYVWTGEELILWGGFTYEGLPQSDGFRYNPSTDTWNSISTSGAPAGGSSFWTGTEILVWGGISGGGVEAQGARYSPGPDQWIPISSEGAPSPRAGYSAVWTGEEMWVWGGSDGADRKDGGRYNPRTDRWSTIDPTDFVTAFTGAAAVWTGEQMLIWQGSTAAGAAYGLPRGKRWAMLPTTDAPLGREFHTAVWTGEEMLIWGGRSGDDLNLGNGARYRPTSAQWVNLPDSNLEGRYDHVAVWTGTEMIVWGGFTMSSSRADGARYHRASDTWKPIAQQGAPAGRGGTVAVWTGTEMIIWGGVGDSGLLNDGSRYNPETDRWTPLPPTDLSPRRAHCAVWTGTELIIWGGLGADGTLNDGRRFDPVRNTWTPLPAANAPAVRAFPEAVWTGKEMVVWGGFDESSGVFVNSGGRYDPAKDRWEATSLTDAPSPRWYGRAVWNGRAMVVWGGSADLSSKVPLNDGASYDPASDIWSALPATDLRGRTVHSAVWTGQEMLLWGGRTGDTRLNDGARYPGRSLGWETLASAGARTDHTAIWTGSEMLVWGGLNLTSVLGDGLRYQPAADHWAPLSGANAPSPRHGHTAIWTGEKMVVWGGSGDVSTAYRGDGALFDPQSNSWQSLNSQGSPSPRADHSAVWTGTEMIIWGGGGQGGNLANGARYNPATDTWAPVTTLGSPAPRRKHAAVWTGTEMIIFGGNERSGARYRPATDTWSPITVPYVVSFHIANESSGVWSGNELLLFGENEGWRYNPSENTWTPMASLGRPTSRLHHSATWTGREMIVWGGQRSGETLSDGASYDPERDVWTPLQNSGSPESRMGHTAIWTGSEMVIHGGLDQLLREGTSSYLPGKVMTLYQRP